MRLSRSIRYRSERAWGRVSLEELSMALEICVPQKQATDNESSKVGPLPIL